MRAIETKM